MRAFKTLDDLNVKGRRVLVRVDFNVPMKNGTVTDATRIERALPTILELTKKGARVILLSHFGRPDGEARPEFSLAPVAAAAGAALGARVRFASDCIGDAASSVAGALEDGDVAMFENTRFHGGEEKNDPTFAQALAVNGDLFVNDAFSAAHRAHASTEGIAHLLPSAAGRAMEKELDYLTAALSAPKRPLMAVVGGAKVSTKIELLLNLVGKADVLAVGGGMANTFLFADGKSVGKSLCEPGLAETARAIMEAARGRGCEIILPDDVVVAEKFEAHAPHETVPADGIGADKMALDLGPATVDRIVDAIEAARTLVWNGPLGAFEIEPFDTATVEAAKFAGKRCRDGALVAVAGGGDTVAALNHAQAADDFTYVSTAGGAFLEWLEGKTLPGVDALRMKTQ